MRGTRPRSFSSAVRSSPVPSRRPFSPRHRSRRRPSTRPREARKRSPRVGRATTSPATLEPVPAALADALRYTGALGSIRPSVRDPFAGLVVTLTPTRLAEAPTALPPPSRLATPCRSHRRLLALGLLPRTSGSAGLGVTSAEASSQPATDESAAPVVEPSPEPLTPQAAAPKAQPRRPSLRRPNLQRASLRRPRRRTSSLRLGLLLRRRPRLPATPAPSPQPSPSTPSAPTPPATSAAPASEPESPPATPAPQTVPATPAPPTPAATKFTLVVTNPPITPTDPITAPGPPRLD